jgi:hypothetical protein
MNGKFQILLTSQIFVFRLVECVKVDNINQNASKDGKWRVYIHREKATSNISYVGQTANFNERRNVSINKDTLLPQHERMIAIAECPDEAIALAVENVAIQLFKLIFFWRSFQLSNFRPICFSAEKRVLSIICDVLNGPRNV